nr:uncharacterized protein LOC113805966 [Penaeus vannamei]
MKRLRVEVATLSELRKPGSDKISLMGIPTIGRARAMVTISSRRQPLVVEVSPVDKHIMALRLEHVFDFVSPLALYAPTSVCKLYEKEAFYDKHVCGRQTPLARYLHCILGDLNAVSGSKWLRDVCQSLWLRG